MNIRVVLMLSVTWSVTYHDSDSWSVTLLEDTNITGRHHVIKSHQLDVTLSSKCCPNIVTHTMSTDNQSNWQWNCSASAATSWCWTWQQVWQLCSRPTASLAVSFSRQKSPPTIIRNSWTWRPGQQQEMMRHTDNILESWGNETCSETIGAVEQQMPTTFWHCQLAARWWRLARQADTLTTDSWLTASQTQLNTKTRVTSRCWHAQPTYQCYNEDKSTILPSTCHLCNSLSMAGNSVILVKLSG